MKLTFHVDSDAFYDCTLHIRDARGARAYHMTAYAAEGGATSAPLTVSVEGATVEIVTLPKATCNLQEDISQYKGDTFVETLIVKMMGKALNTFYQRGILLAAVTYRLSIRERLGTETGGDDSIHLHLTQRIFSPSPAWTTELLETYPLLYGFFELAEGESPHTPTAVRDLNGLEVLRFLRKLMLAQAGILAYPFLMSPIKRLTRPKVMLRQLKKLYRLPPEKRVQKFRAESF